MAFPNGRFTSASRTPSTLLNAPSTWATHEAQVIPWTESSILSVSSSYPALSTALANSSKGISRVASTTAFPVATFTFTSAIPWSEESAPSTCAAHEAQVIPRMGSTSFFFIVAAF